MGNAENLLGRGPISNETICARLVPTIVCVALLSACASNAPHPRGKQTEDRLCSSTYADCTALWCDALKEDDAHNTDCMYKCYERYQQCMGGAHIDAPLDACNKKHGACVKNCEKKLVNDADRRQECISACDEARVRCLTPK